MASQLSIDLVEQALSSHTPVPLSYGDPHQKWLIRSHVITLLRDHPAFTPSFGAFAREDGSRAYLLFVSGLAKGVPITIWLHENHPLMAPIVHVSDDLIPVRSNHPFVGPSGQVTCPYLLTWAHPGSSLSGLVTNLLRLFARDHPLQAPSRAAPSNCHPALVSRREALDRLAATAYYDVSSLGASTTDDIHALLALRDSAVERAREGERAVAALEEERAALREAAAALAEDADVAVNWLRVNDLERIAVAIGGEGDVEAAFEASDVAAVECLAAERGVEDAMDVLDVAVKEGLVGLEVYVKQVRLLAREQFYHRAMAVKLLRGSAMDWGCY